MRHSDNFAAVAAAVLAAQSDIPGITKDARNPEFRSRYVTLDTLIATVRPILNHHGLAILQGSEHINDGTIAVETVLLHTSGEWVSTTIVMPVVGRTLKGGEVGPLTPQAAGSAVSYGRRYGLATLLCIASDDDDDGQAASQHARPAATPARPQPARPAQAPIAAGADRAANRAAQAAAPPAAPTKAEASARANNVDAPAAVAPTPAAPVRQEDVILPGTKAHLQGYGGKRVADVPTKLLAVIADELRTIGGAKNNKYQGAIDALEATLMLRDDANDAGSGPYSG